ncbi:hypothetical protein Lfu02_28130 [Longispora fulva]|uniref:Secreted protein n=1 Tax=Longispora fulva TaxID=619741 RepID=A0A8J7GE53_9ACTN|nr:hypothetical protein [Longispora fulva]MBG6138948.1 hypothetical protein [Longispora fulva]GIG58441.1 hypothetical protein Lfu02_28130 [Longispora fulva]
MRTLTRLAAICAMVVPALFGVSTAAHAEAAPGCSDSYQIGPTALLSWNGESAASVKQFWSPRCQANFAYLYVWQSFRTNHPTGNWSVNVGEIIWDDGMSGWMNYSPSRSTDFWSRAVAGLGQCTRASAAFNFNGVYGNATTDPRCG